MRNELKAMPLSALATVLLVTLANMLLPRRIPVPVVSWTRLSLTTMPVERTAVAPDAKKFVVCSRRMPLTTFFAMFLPMLTVLMPLALTKIARAASIDVPSAPPRPTPLEASVVLSPSTVKPSKVTPEAVIVITAPDVVFVVAGTKTASGTRVPPLGDTFQFGPLITSALLIVTFSA